MVHEGKLSRFEAKDLNIFSQLHLFTNEWINSEPGFLWRFRLTQLSKTDEYTSRFWNLFPEPIVSDFPKLYKWSIKANVFKTSLLIWERRPISFFQKWKFTEYFIFYIFYFLYFHFFISNGSFSVDNNGTLKGSSVYLMPEDYPCFFSIQLSTK